MSMAVEAQVLERARARAGGDASLGLFLERAIAAIDPDDLARQNPQSLIEALVTSHERLTDGPTEVTRVLATPPAQPGAPLLLDIISPDMPFIVDSALGALRAMGGVIRLFAHPVLQLSRGRVVSEGGAPVSMLHIQSDPVTDTAALVAELEATLRVVALAVGDWQPMLERVRRAATGLDVLKPALRDEADRFVDWLTEHNFTFLGLREYRLKGKELTPVEGSGLGILRDPDLKVLRSGPHYVESTPELVAFLEGPDPVLVTKANVRSRVHRRAHMDYVGIKLFDAAGTVTGELRVVGLYTAQALAAPHTDVPLIRRKIAEVMRESGFDPLGHAGRTLLGALDS